MYFRLWNLIHSICSNRHHNSFSFSALYLHGHIMRAFGAISNIRKLRGSFRFRSLPQVDIKAGLHWAIVQVTILRLLNLLLQIILNSYMPFELDPSSLSAIFLYCYLDVVKMPKVPIQTVECGSFDSCSLMGPISPSLIGPHPSAEKSTLQT